MPETSMQSGRILKTSKAKANKVPDLHSSHLHERYVRYYTRAHVQRSFGQHAVVVFPFILEVASHAACVSVLAGTGLVVFGLNPVNDAGGGSAVEARNGCSVPPSRCSGHWHAVGPANSENVMHWTMPGLA